VTPRQREIIETYRNSRSLREAAAKLGISWKTVRDVVANKAPEIMHPQGMHPQYRRVRIKNE